MTQQVLDDFRSAPIGEKLKAMLGFLQKMTLEPEQLGGGDVVPLRKAGLDDKAIEDALYVAFAFNLIDRLADSFDFDLMTEAQYARSAQFLLKAGYRL